MKDRLRKLVSHNEHLLDAYLGLRLRTTLFSPMVHAKEVISTYAKGDRAKGFAVLRFALFSSCAQDIIKLTMDKDRRTPSVTNIMAVLADGRIRQELRARYSAWHLPRDTKSNLGEELLVKFEQEQQARFSTEFDRIFSELEQAWSDFQSQPWVTGLQDLRDKITAHLELVMTEDGYQPVAIDSLGLKWGDLDDAMNRLEEIVLKINAVGRQAGFAIQDARAQFDRAANAFWAV